MCVSVEWGISKIEEYHFLTSGSHCMDCWQSVGNMATWSANAYAPDLEFTLSAENMSVPMMINADKRGGSFGPLYSQG